MQTGTPSITTKIGAEGMHQDLKWNGTIAESVTDIAQAAIHLYTNKIAWQEAQQNGIQIINGLYNRTTHEENFAVIIDNLKNTLEQHRATNFIGSMLVHHSLASTKYMSKWIEEKNKIN